MPPNISFSKHYFTIGLKIEIQHHCSLLLLNLKDEDIMSSMCDNEGGHRSFGGLDEHLTNDNAGQSSSEGNLKKINSKSFFESLNDDIIGNYNVFSTPFGKRPVIYADWTASGRAVGQIENYIRDSVLPFFGNTHTSTSITGLQSTCFRQESRQIIAQAVNARITGKASPDAVIFTGNGVTASIHKLISSLGLHVPLPPSAFSSEGHCDIPVVFTTGYEHHSNLLSWRETAADVVTVAYHPVTGVCLADLHRLLVKYSSRKCKIGAFSACSNVTGLMTPTEAVSIVMHRHGGLVVFDYASSAPYVKMDMNPVDVSGCMALFHGLYGGGSAEPSFGLPAFSLDDRKHAYKDAIMFSGHKFLGGPGSPGVLVVKKNLLLPISERPTIPGGGTVFYVTEGHQRYLSNREEREEAGTPNVIGDIRIGLVVQLKQLANSALKNDPSAASTWLGSVPASASTAVTIEDIEVHLAKQVQTRLEAIPNVVLLGRFPGGKAPNSSLAPRHLPIFSFLVRYPNSNKFYHYNFICALLNDLFGIQARGGCQCAGPFSQQIMGITDGEGVDTNTRYEVALLEKHEVLRPGYARLAFPYWMTHQDVEYIVGALEFVSSNAWKFLPQYKCNLKTGEWAHHSRFTKFPNRLWLSNSMDLSTYSSGGGSTNSGSVQKNCESAVSGGSSNFNSHLATLMEELNDPTSKSKTQKGHSDQEKRTQLYAAIRSQVEAECSKIEKEILTRHNKNKGKKGDLGGAGGTALKVDMKDHSGLRWFILQDEAENINDLIAPGETVPGVDNAIKPEGWMDTWNHSFEKGAAALTADSDSEVGVAAAGSSIIEDTMYDTSSTENLAANLYGHHRATKMTVHDHRTSARDAQRLPRYMRSAADGGVLPGQYLTATTPAVGSSGLSVHQEVGVVPSSAHPAIGSVPAVATVPRPTATESNSDVLVDDSMTCVDGTCFLRKRNTEAVVPSVPIDSNTGVSGATASAVTSDGRILYIDPPKKIMKLVGQAVKDWSMFEEGDRVLLGLSGGKDSLSMLHILLALQKRSPVKFSISCCTIDPQTDSFDPRAIVPYMEALGRTPNKVNKQLHGNGHAELVENTNIPYHFISEPIIELARSKMQGDSLCAFCSRFKRGLLYKCCRDHKYNKLVLAQHLDDLAESFLMSTLHNGQMRTMKANYSIESGENIRVVRPFVYVREQTTKEFSMSANLPVINENCPACFEQPKERDRVKRLLAQEEVMVPALFSNLKHSLLPLMDDAIYESMSRVTDKITSNNSRFHLGTSRGGKSGTLAANLGGKTTVDNSASGSSVRNPAVTAAEESEMNPSKRMKTSA